MAQPILPTTTRQPKKPKESIRDIYWPVFPLGCFNFIIAVISEFLASMCYFFLALAGTQVAHTTLLPGVPAAQAASEILNPTAQPLYVALVFGMSLLVMGWAWFKVTSGLFNPAITLAMACLSLHEPGRAVGVICAQIAGGLAGAGLVSCVFPGPLAAETTLGVGTSVVRGFFIELLLTAVFVFTVLIMAKETHKGSYPAMIGIGLSLFLAELVGVPFTGGSFNPARSFATAAVNHHFPRYHWIYWIAPFLGGALAAGMYSLTKILEVETEIATKKEINMGHRRGPSNSGTVVGAGGGLPHSRHSDVHGHVLQPVQEQQDLEKGSERGQSVPATAGGAGPTTMVREIETK